MTRKILLFALFVCALAVQGRSLRDSIYVSGKVYDRLTRVELAKAKITLLTMDSTELKSDSSSASVDYSRYGLHNYYDRGGRFAFKVATHGKYLLRAEREGYETTYAVIDIPERQKNRRLTTYHEAEILMKRVRQPMQENELGEAVVRATKIKMVMRGDTVVYNASAFQLSEGSMLDQLLSQLDGMKIEDGGVITHNGRRVESLLVNGKDFFKGDPKIALENLPAYMVKDVKVYRKESDHAYLQKNKAKVEEEKALVVDVGLKRQYAQGWIVSAEGARGTGDHWLGRVLALRYTDHSRLSLFANANNLNDTKKPGREGDWNKAWEPAGTLILRMAGINFNWDDKKTKIEVSSSLTALSETMQEQQQSSSVRYLADGDTYGRSDQRSRNRQAHIEWQNRVKFPFKKFSSTWDIKADYFHNRITSLQREATFSADPLDSYRNASLDSLYAPAFSPRLQRSLISQVDNAGLTRSQRWVLDVSSENHFQSPWTGNDISIQFFGNYQTARNRNFSHYSLRQPALGSPSFQNQYQSQPSLRYRYWAFFNYDWEFAEGWSAGMNYEYAQRYDRGERDWYRLDSLSGWDNASRRIGTLPSTTDSLHRALDYRNSFFTATRSGEHSLSPGLSYYKKGVQLSLYPRFRFLRERVEDFRNRRQQQAERNLTLADLSSSFFYYPSPGKHLYGNLSYSTEPFSVNYLLRTEDTSNPLVRQLTNPDLRNPRSFNVSTYAQTTFKGYKRTLFLNIYYNLRQNAIAQAMTYDRRTGVSTYMPRNVNGNWDGRISLDYRRNLDSLGRWNINMNQQLIYGNNADYISDGRGGSLRSSVRNCTWESHLRLNYQFKKVRLQAQGSMVWQHLTSHRPDFNAIHALNFNYGITANVTLPAGIDLATDLNMFSRRGYDDPTMNDDRLVWNASLSRGFFKGKPLTVSVEGYDILGQLDNVRRSLNGQGRSETWYNVVPRYFLLRLAYRFSVQPKRNQ